MRIAEVPLVHERTIPSADTVLHAHERLLKNNRDSLDRTARMVTMTFSNQLYHVQGLKKLYPDANVQFPPGETRQYYYDLLTDPFTHEPSQLANLWKLFPSAADPQEPFSHPRDRELFHILAYTSNKLKSLDKNGKTYHPKTRKMPDGSRVSYAAHTLLEVPHFIQTYTKDGNVSDLALALAAAHDVGEEGTSASIRGNKISTEQEVDPAELVSRFSYEHIGTQLAIGAAALQETSFSDMREGIANSHRKEEFDKLHDVTQEHWKWLSEIPGAQEQDSGLIRKWIHEEPFVYGGLALQVPLVVRRLIDQAKGDSNRLGLTPTQLTDLAATIIQVEIGDRMADIAGMHSIAEESVAIPHKEGSLSIPLAHARTLLYASRMQNMYSKLQEAASYLPASEKEKIEGLMHGYQEILSAQLEKANTIFQEHAYGEVPPITDSAFQTFYTSTYKPQQQAADAIMERFVHKKVDTIFRRTEQAVKILAPENKVSIKLTTRQHESTVEGSQRPFVYRDIENIDVLFSLPGVSGINVILDNYPEMAKVLNEELDRRKVFRNAFTEALGKPSSADKLAAVREIYTAYQDKPLSLEEISIFMTQFKELGDPALVREVYQRASWIPDVRHSQVLREFYAVATNKLVEGMLKKSNGNTSGESLQEIYSLIDQSIQFISTELQGEEYPVKTGEMYAALGKAYRLKAQIREQESLTTQNATRALITATLNGRKVGDKFVVTKQEAENMTEQLYQSEVATKAAQQEITDLYRLSQEAYANGYQQRFEFYPGITSVEGLLLIAGREHAVHGKTDIAQQRFEQAQRLAEMVRLSTESSGGIQSQDYWCLATMLEAAIITHADEETVSTLLSRTKKLARNLSDVESTLSSWSLLSKSLRLFENEGKDGIARQLDTAAQELRGLFDEQGTRLHIAADETEKNGMSEDDLNLAFIKERLGLQYAGYGEGHLSVAVPGNLNFGGQLHDHAISRYDQEVLSERILDSLQLHSVSDMGEFSKIVDGFIRNQFETQLLEEDLLSPDHIRYDDTVKRLLNEFGFFSKEVKGHGALSTTNVLADFLIGLGDCRNHAWTKQMIFEAWKRDKINGSLRKGYEALMRENNTEAFTQAVEKTRKLTQTHMFIFDAKVFSPVKLQDGNMYAIIRDEKTERPLALGAIGEDGMMLDGTKPEDYSKWGTEEHTLNCVVMPGEDGRLTLYSADAFYQNEYGFGWGQRDTALPISQVVHIIENNGLWYAGETDVYDESVRSIKSAKVFVKPAAYAGSGKDEKTRAVQPPEIADLLRIRGIVRAPVSQQTFREILGLDALTYEEDAVMQETRQKQSISRGIVSLVENDVHRFVPNASAFDVSSFVSNTNKEGEFDIDVVVAGVPFGPTEDAASVGNAGKTLIEYRDLDELRRLDKAGRLFASEASTRLRGQGVSIAAERGLVTNIIDSTLDSLRRISPDAQPAFERLKAWDNAAGAVFTVSVNYPNVGRVKFDITLYNGRQFFGIEHRSRFNAYMQDVEQTQGIRSTAQLLRNIRDLKQLLTDRSQELFTRYGRDTYETKIPGFIIESLFTQGKTPLSYRELIQSLAEILPLVNQSALKDQIPYQSEQLVGSGKSLEEIVELVTKGGLDVLREVVFAEQERLGLLSN